MATVAGTQEEWTIHALNIHGVFFERRCAVAVTEAPSWKVLSTNYPVEFPPPNGPWRGKESSLDIWARRDNDPNFVVDVMIECKKANPEFVNWVFFPRPEFTAPSQFSFAKVDNTLNPSGTGSWSTKVSLQRMPSDLAIANDAREVRGDYLKHQSGNKTKTSNAAIQEASYQVALANRAIVQEEISLLAKACASSEHPAPPWPSKRYVPMIVTTAQLFQVDFSTSSTDLRSGEIGLQDATLTPIQSILYEYALPKHLQYSPGAPLHVLTSGDTDTFSRMHIMVVHAEALSEFLRNLFTEPSSE